MEKQFQLQLNGQQVIQADFNLLGETSALADDRVFAELLRMTPYDGSTVARGVMPTGTDSLVAPNGASGSVKINPFRAFIGSRVASPALDNWRDIRSAVSIGSASLALAANSSGNPRWDLVYAAVAVDAASATVTRKHKHPTTKVISDQSVVLTKVTTVTLAAVTGTPGASPTWPAAPSDAGGTYYIPLAYVRVPNGFNATSTVIETDVGAVAPTVRVRDTAGGMAVQPANSLHNLASAKVQSWGASGIRPDFFAPATVTGGESLIVALDLTTGSLSHAQDAVIDDSRDWRGRICKWTAVVGAVGETFAWTDGGTSPIPDASGLNSETTDTATRTITYGMGQTFGDGHMVAHLSSLRVAGMAGSTDVVIYVDGTGALKLDLNGTSPNCKVLFWLEFSGRFDNCDIL